MAAPAFDLTDENNPLAQLLKAPAEVLHLSAARAEEVMNAKPGDITSTGRELCLGWNKGGLEEAQKWGEAPLPTRTKDYHNHHQNSDKFDLVVPRPGDIVIDTSYKSGTTWTQAIVANLIFKGKIDGWDDSDFAGVMNMSPWVDMRIPPPHATEEHVKNQTFRRFLKSHLCLDGLPYNADTKYVVVIRDLRDVAYSWMNHWYKARDFFEEFFAHAPGLVGDRLPSPDGWTAKMAFDDLADPESEGLKCGLWSYWHHIATWWQYRNLPNIKLMHYANMTKDPRGEIAKLAKFLEIEVTSEELDLVVHNTTIEYMKQHSAKILGAGFETFFEGGGNSFIHKGKNGRWKDELTEEQCARYIEFGKQRLGEDAMHWVLTGEGLE